MLRGGTLAVTGVTTLSNTTDATSSTAVGTIVSGGNVAEKITEVTLQFGGIGCYRRNYTIKHYRCHLKHHSKTMCLVARGRKNKHGNNATVGGTLAVTGKTTLSDKLEVTGVTTLHPFTTDATSSTVGTIVLVK